MNDLESVVLISVGIIECAVSAYLLYAVTKGRREKLKGNYAPITMYNVASARQTHEKTPVPETIQEDYVANPKVVSKRCIRTRW